MFIVEYGIGIAILIVFVLMISGRLQVIRQLPVSTSRKIFIIIFWVVPISQRNRSTEAIELIRKANKFLYLLALLIVVWIIILQF